MTTTPLAIPSVSTPDLLPVDLSKGTGSDHPDIIPGRTYLACYDGRWELGQFSRQWYGLLFSGFYPSGCKFESPKTVYSEWMALFEFKENLQTYECEIVLRGEDGDLITNTHRHKFLNALMAWEWWAIRLDGLRKSEKLVRASFTEVV